MGRIRTKVCCINSVAEAALAIRYGADALGLVTEMPSGPGIISDDLARAIAACTPPPIATFLLTSRLTGRDIADHVDYCKTSTVQIVDHIDPGEYETIISRLPSTRRVQVIHIEGVEAIEMALVYEPFVHALLLDSGRTNSAQIELGGTGRTHDWEISAEIVRRVDKPVFLAGGLQPMNVQDAISAVRPFGLDLCSGIRTNDDLDEAKLASFMQQIAGSGG